MKEATLGQVEETMRRRNRKKETMEYERAVYRGHLRPANLYFLNNDNNNNNAKK